MARRSGRSRRYVRDDRGRFASGGGSGKRKGKLSKSTSGRSAKAKYKSASSKVRKTERDFKSARRSSSIMSKKASRANWTEKATAKAMVAGAKFDKAGGRRNAAKGQLTRVTNEMTKRRVAAGGRGVKELVDFSISGTYRKPTKRVAAKAKRAGKAPSAFGKTAKYTRQGKVSKASGKGRAAQAEWKAARRADRTGPLGEGRALDRNQKRVIKKQTGKTAYAQGYRQTPAKTKAPRAGSKTKAQKIRTKIDRKKSYNKMERGSEFKGKKKRVTKKAAAAAIKKRDAARYAEFSKKNKAARKGGLKPKKGETAKSFKARLKRSSKNPDTQRALRDPEGRKGYYSNPAQDGARRKRRTTAKSKRRAESRETWGDGTGGNKRSRAITKSKQRHRAKLKKIEGKFNKKKR